MLFDLNPEIEGLAGSTKARELLVKTSPTYLDSLAAEGNQMRSGFFAAPGHYGASYSASDTYGDLMMAWEKKCGQVSGAEHVVSC